jgi:hypothetical protein
MALLEALAAFERQSKAFGKGALSVLLVVTDHARQSGLPLDPARLRTEGGGQVLGLGKAAVQKILARHGIDRVLAEEGGRTNRGGLGLMEAYVAFLNQARDLNDLDLAAVEAFWINRVRGFFAAKPIPVRTDAALGLKEIVRLILAEAEHRQKQMHGATVVGAVMQHLVGARLSLSATTAPLTHHSFATADAGLGRAGDFLIGETAIHVTASATEALIAKCARNLGARLNPVIITLPHKADLARGLIENAGLAGRIDVFHIDQFIALSLLDWSGCDPGRRVAEAARLVDAYNAIIDAVETDPGLRLKLI